MTIGVGIIGLGMATKPHMTSLRELEAASRAKIVGGFAPSPERRHQRHRAKARAIEHGAFRPARAAAYRGHLIRRRQTRLKPA